MFNASQAPKKFADQESFFSVINKPENYTAKYVLFNLAFVVLAANIINRNNI